MDIQAMFTALIAESLENDKLTQVNNLSSPDHVGGKCSCGNWEQDELLGE